VNPVAFFVIMSVTYDFKGKRVLVTGGASGLGKAVCLKFLQSGAKVFALDRNADNLKKLREEHPGIEVVVADLLDWEQSRKAVETLQISVGGFHHLINNAGIPEAAYFNDLMPDSIDRIFGVNFKALINMGQVMAKGHKAHGVDGGTIVNISSVMDNKTIPGVSLYCCTKAAVTMLTKCMAVELGPQNIRVNCVRPTLMQTELLSTGREFDQKMGGEVWNFVQGKQTANMQRLCTVEEATDAVLYLSSDASSMVNGSGILVDGGVYTA